MNNEMFQAICLKIAEEEDPRKLDLLKQRLRLLLSDEDSPDPTTSHRIRARSKSTH
jgi:hypothetical protein